MLSRSFAAVCRDLEHTSARVRLSAIQESARHATGEGRYRVAELLLGILSQADVNLRIAALVALADAQLSEAIPRILPFLSDGDLETRRSAIMALGELAPSGDADLLSKISPFFTATDPRIRYQAIAAAFAIASFSMLDTLADAAVDSDPLIRELVARLLDEGIAESGCETPAGARDILRQLAQDPVLAVRAVAQLSCHEHGFEAPLDGVLALIYRSLPARELRDEQIAIELGGRLRLRDSIKALERRAFGLLGLGGDTFRYPARAALAALGHERARRSVERGLKRGSRIERAALIVALGQMKVSEFIAEVEQAAQDPDLREIAERAVEAMRRADP